MKPDLKKLEGKLKELDKKIAEVNKRMPAHSAKPTIMTELFALEDERDEVFKQLEVLKQKKTGK
jgi:hypothetical protein